MILGIYWFYNFIDVHIKYSHLLNQKEESNKIQKTEILKLRKQYLKRALISMIIFVLVFTALGLFSLRVYKLP